MVRSAIDNTVLRAGTSKRTGGEQRLPGLHRGVVVDVDGAGRVYFTLPRVTGSQVLGPYPALVTGLVAEQRVLVGSIDGRIDDLVVLNIL